MAILTYRQYISDVEGAALFGLIGKKIELKFNAERVASKAYNVIGRKNCAEKKIVLCAHIDTKINTPGALDNAAGLSVLLLLAQILADYGGLLEVEIVALNGEDYYSARGNLMYMENIIEDKQHILAGINIDGAGYKSGKSTYSLFGFNKEQRSKLETVFKAGETFKEIENWYQSDHMLFVLNDVKAIAITSEEVCKITAELAHTEKDTIENIDFYKLAEIAEALNRIIREWSHKK